MPGVEVACGKDSEGVTLRFARAIAAAPSEYAGESQFAINMETEHGSGSGRTRTILSADKNACRFTRSIVRRKNSWQVSGAGLSSWFWSVSLVREMTLGSNFKFSKGIQFFPIVLLGRFTGPATYYWQSSRVPSQGIILGMTSVACGSSS